MFGWRLKINNYKPLKVSRNAERCQLIRTREQMKNVFGGPSGRRVRDGNGLRDP